MYLLNHFDAIAAFGCSFVVILCAKFIAQAVLCEITKRIKLNAYFVICAHVLVILMSCLITLISYVMS